MLRLARRRRGGGGREEQHRHEKRHELSEREKPRLRLPERDRKDQRDPRHRDRLRCGLAQGSRLRHAKRQIANAVVHLAESPRFVVVRETDLHESFRLVGFLHPDKERCDAFLTSLHDGAHSARDRAQKPDDGGRNEQRHERQYDVVPEENRRERNDLHAVANEHDRRLRRVREREVRFVYEFRENESRRVALIRVFRPVHETGEHLGSKPHHDALTHARQQHVARKHAQTVETGNEHESQRRGDHDPGILFIKPRVGELSQKKRHERRGPRGRDHGEKRRRHALFEGQYVGEKAPHHRCGGGRHKAQKSFQESVPVSSVFFDGRTPERSASPSNAPMSTWVGIDTAGLGRLLAKPNRSTARSGASG